MWLDCCWNEDAWMLEWSKVLNVNVAAAAAEMDQPSSSPHRDSTIQAVAPLLSTCWLWSFPFETVRLQEVCPSFIPIVFCEFLMRLYNGLHLPKNNIETMRWPLIQSNFTAKMNSPMLTSGGPFYLLFLLL
ncbi:hypothetical protein VIGAN_UM008500 [Vigna angularis var. angularis]|uniref:Uncharacterized protein n=1 Tax=Vigna angularis var. angularis TaxID=157739 RepID=A0A0S3TDB7_PHAAN|nr:hypothetical protein VIGAN_UM008500 [Vigna angularis var. angularis]